MAVSKAQQYARCKSLRGPTSPAWGGIVSLPLDALETAQRAAQAAGETPPEFTARAIDTQAKRDQASLRLGINPATGGKLEKVV